MVEEKKKTAVSEPDGKPIPVSVDEKKKVAEQVDPNAALVRQSDVKLKEWPLLTSLGETPYSGYAEKGNVNHSQNSEHALTEPDAIPANEIRPNASLPQVEETDAPNRNFTPSEPYVKGVIDKTIGNSQQARGSYPAATGDASGTQQGLHHIEQAADPNRNFAATRGRYPIAYINKVLSAASGAGGSEAAHEGDIPSASSALASPNEAEAGRHEYTEEDADHTFRGAVNPERQSLAELANNTNPADGLDKITRRGVTEDDSTHLNEIMNLDKRDPNYFSKLAAILSERPMTQEEVDRRNRGAAASQAIAGIGNAVNALANVAFAGGAPSQQLPKLFGVDYDKLSDKAKQQRLQYAQSMMRGAQADYQAYKQAEADKESKRRFDAQMDYKKQADAIANNIQMYKLNIANAKNENDRKKWEEKLKLEEKKLNELNRHNRTMEGIAQQNANTNEKKTKNEKDKLKDSNVHYNPMRFTIKNGSNEASKKFKDFDMNNPNEIYKAWSLIKKNDMLGWKDMELDYDKVKDYKEMRALMLSRPDGYVAGNSQGVDGFSAYNDDGGSKGKWASEIKF